MGASQEKPHLCPYGLCPSSMPDSFSCPTQACSWTLLSLLTSPPPRCSPVVFVADLPFTFWHPSLFTLRISALELISYLSYKTMFWSWYSVHVPSSSRPSIWLCTSRFFLIAHSSPGSHIAQRLPRSNNTTQHNTSYGPFAIFSGIDFVYDGRFFLKVV